MPAPDHVTPSLRAESPYSVASVLAEVADLSHDLKVADICTQLDAIEFRGANFDTARVANALAKLMKWLGEAGR